jgi:hypothetical protein
LAEDEGEPVEPPSTRTPVVTTSMRTSSRFISAPRREMPDCDACMV